MAESWHVAKGKTKLGPFSRDQLKRLAQSGQLKPADMVLPVGAAKWAQAGTIAGVFVQPAAAAPKRPAPARPASPPKRSKGRLLVILGAVAAACACLIAVPAALAVYYFVVVPARTVETQVIAAAATQPVVAPPQPEAPRPAPPPVTPPPETIPPPAPKAADPPMPSPPAPERPINEPPAPKPPKADPPRADPPPRKNPPAADALSTDALVRVKRSTVYLRVTLPDGRVAEGSGFLTGAPGVVITNGHVVGMLSPEGRPPQKIEVVISSGTPQEKAYTGRLAQVDARDDLAAVLISGDDLPPPLPIGRAIDLIETQAVYIFGFPFGKQLGRNITVSNSAVSSIRTKKDGSIQDLIVGGGMNPGNSGGPFVDANGLVVGVSVAIIAGTQINFAIAGETVRSFLHGRMEKRVYMSPYREGDKLKLPIRYHMTDPLGQIAKVVVETWTGKSGPARPATPAGADPMPDDSPRKSYELRYEQYKAVGEVDLPVLSSKEQALWVQLALVRRDGSRQWYPAATYSSNMAPVERKPVTLSYSHRPDVPYKLEMTQKTDLKIRGLNGLDKHLVTEMKAQMYEQLIGKSDADGTMPGLVLFKKVTVTTSLDKEVRRNARLENSLKSIAGVAAITLVDRQGDLRLLEMGISKNIRDTNTKLDLVSIGSQLLASLEAVSVPLPGQEVRHEEPWKVTREIILGSSAQSDKPAVMDVDCILHGLRERNGRPEAVIFLFGQVRAAAGATLGASGYMDGVASVDLKTNQVGFAEANFNLDIDLSDGEDHFQANGTRKITLVRTPLEAGERDQFLKGFYIPPAPTPPAGSRFGPRPGMPGRPGMPKSGGPKSGGPRPGGPRPGQPPPGGPPAGNPMAGGRTQIMGGGGNATFEEAAPNGGLLIGFELGLQKFFNNDVVRAMRPVFRAGDNESLGTQRGTVLDKVVRVVAKPGYAVGAIIVKAGATVDGMGAIFMKVTPDGRLNPNDSYQSDWIGGQGGGAPQRLGNGTPVIGVIGRTDQRDMTGLGLLLR
jgi:S1-C subfamily serine protease